MKICFKMSMILFLQAFIFFSVAHATDNLPVVYAPVGGPVKVVEISDVSDPELLKEKLLLAIESAAKESELSPEDLSASVEALKKAIDLDLFLSPFHTKLLAEALKRTESKFSLLEAQTDGGARLVEEMFKIFSEILQRGVKPAFVSTDLYMKLLDLRGDSTFLQAYRTLLQMSYEELTFLVRSKITFTRPMDIENKPTFSGDDIHEIANISDQNATANAVAKLASDDTEATSGVLTHISNRMLLKSSDEPNWLAGGVLASIAVVAHGTYFGLPEVADYFTHSNEFEGPMLYLALAKLGGFSALVYGTQDRFEHKEKPFWRFVGGYGLGSGSMMFLLPVVAPGLEMEAAWSAVFFGGMGTALVHEALRETFGKGRLKFKIIPQKFKNLFSFSRGKFANLRKNEILKFERNLTAKLEIAEADNDSEFEAILGRSEYRIDQITRDTINPLMNKVSTTEREVSTSELEDIFAELGRYILETSEMQLVYSNLIHAALSPVTKAFGLWKGEPNESNRRRFADSILLANKRVRAMASHLESSLANVYLLEKKMNSFLKQVNNGEKVLASNTPDTQQILRNINEITRIGAFQFIKLSMENFKLRAEQTRSQALQQFIQALGMANVDRALNHETFEIDLSDTSLDRQFGSLESDGVFASLDPKSFISWVTNATQDAFTKLSAGKEVLTEPASQARVSTCRQILKN